MKLPYSRTKFFLPCLFLCLLISPAFPQAASPSAASPAPATRSQDEQRAYRTAMEDADQKIDAEVKAHSELVKNLA